MLESLKKEPFNTFAMTEPLQDLFDHNVPKEGENKIKTRRPTIQVLSHFHTLVENGETKLPVKSIFSQNFDIKSSLEYYKG